MKAQPLHPEQQPEEIWKGIKSLVLFTCILKYITYGALCNILMFSIQILSVYKLEKVKPITKQICKCYLSMETKGKKKQLAQINNTVSQILLMKIVANLPQTTSIQNGADIVNTFEQQGVNRIVAVVK